MESKQGNKLHEIMQRTKSQFLKPKNKWEYSPLRKVEGIILQKFNQQQPNQSSSQYQQQSKNSSMRNLADSTYMQTANIKAKLRFQKPGFVLPMKNKKSHSSSKQKIIIKNYESVEKKTIKESYLSKKTQTFQQSTLGLEGAVKQLFENHFEDQFIRYFINFMKKDWKQKQEELLRQKRFQSVVSSITQRANFITQLSEEFLTLQYEKYTNKQQRLMSGILAKESNKAIRQMESIILQIVKKIPEDKILRQEQDIDDLFGKILEIYDPKFIYSNSKMKERFSIYFESYTTKKNNLRSCIATKLKGTLDFLMQVQKYFGTYQKQVIKLKNQIVNYQTELNKTKMLLDKKINFTPIQIDYQQIKIIKQRVKQQFFNGLENNLVKFHEDRHDYDTKKILTLQSQINVMKETIQRKQSEIQLIKDKLQSYYMSIPKKQDAFCQVFFQPNKKNVQSTNVSSIYGAFLQNVVTPFSFTPKVTGALINIILVDKILYDYDLIRNRWPLKNMKQFIFDWFIVKTGSKRIAQIFLKNFILSIKQLRTSHKRFQIFAKMCGLINYRKKNVQQDLDFLFFQTQLAWYYFVRVALAYRKKLTPMPSGYHLVPPLICEDICKIPLRKTYQIIDDFFTQEGIQPPADLHIKFDHYAINQISKFKSTDEQFQKSNLQQIHILRQMNFDVIAGFLIQTVSSMKCSTIEKILRGIDLKQKQSGNLIGYSQFESIYRSYYKQRRYKIQQMYAKLCLANQYDLLDIQNSQMVIFSMIEDDSLMRSIFEKVQSLKILILSQKAAIRQDKKNYSPNSFQNFRERYYNDFYDFFHTTTFLQELYRIIKVLIRKKMKAFVKDQTTLDNLIQQKTNFINIEEVNKQSAKNEEQNNQNQEQQDQEQQQSEKTVKQQPNKEQVQKLKSQLQSKIQQWGKIIMRVPHFNSKILTIQQIVVHNMRRKEMIDASEFAWRTLRQLLIMAGED